MGLTAVLSLPFQRPVVVPEACEIGYYQIHPNLKIEVHMPKLHELLAAEGTSKTQADKCRTDLLATFDKKRHLFSQKRVTFLSNEEGKPAQTEEQLDLQTTVPRELKWISEMWAKALDLAYGIDIGNTVAKADVTLDDGTLLLKDVPATALLQLEKRANELHAFIQSIPTLDPAKGFTEDAATGADVYVAREDIRTRTKKLQRALQLSPATDKHPAQVQLITEDVAIGTIKTQEWSGLITPVAKGDMLNRAEELRRALKTARSRANDVPVASNKIGATLLQYVFAGKV